MSPDAAPYVDLTVYDRDAQEVFEQALANLQVYLADWVPREGHTEVLLMESLALEVEETIFAINRIPGAVVEILLRLYGVDRDMGAPPAATFTFTVTDTNGYTIPIGTRLSVPILGGDTFMTFATDAQAVVPEGELTVAVSATADTNTASANGTVPGSAVDMLDSVSSVDRVDLTSYIAGGRDAEADDEWFSRGIQRFARLAETLVLPRHFTAAALEHTEVSRATTIDNYDPNSGNEPGMDAGHVTTAVYGAGDLLTADQKEVIRAEFDLAAQANLAVHVVDPTMTDVNVSATVVGVLGYSVEQVQGYCVAALTEYLSPEQWSWSGTVYRNEIIALLDRVEGVDRVVDVTTPASDLTLTGIAPLARLGTVTITVTGL